MIFSILGWPSVIKRFYNSLSPLNLPSKSITLEKISSIFLLSWDNKTLYSGKTPFIENIEMHCCNIYVKATPVTLDSYL